MAKKTKLGLNYFYHPCHYNDDYKYIFSKYKSDGYKIFFEISRTIHKHFGYYMDAGEKNLYILSSESELNIDTVRNVIADCISVNIFDGSLYNNYHIISSVEYQETYFEVILKGRKKEIEIVKEYFLLDKDIFKKPNFGVKWVNV